MTACGLITKLLQYIQDVCLTKTLIAETLLCLFLCMLLLFCTHYDWMCTLPTFNTYDIFSECEIVTSATETLTDTHLVSFLAQKGKVSSFFFVVLI